MKARRSRRPSPPGEDDHSSKQASKQAARMQATNEAVRDAPGATGTDDNLHATRCGAGRRSALQGRFLICEDAVTAVERFLPTFRGPDGDHEGLIFLAGRELSDAGVTLLTTALAPDCEHGPGHVMADEIAIRGVARAARSLGLAVLAQVHSHPGANTHHSEGDDRMILMPFEGMLSIVVPRYAHFGARPLHTLGVHQYQGQAWRPCTPASVHAGLIVIPAAVDLR